jgi:hypothetical protein
MPVQPDRALLLTAVALAAWTFVMWTWMYVTRIPANRRTGMKAERKNGATLGTGASKAACPMAR